MEQLESMKFHYGDIVTISSTDSKDEFYNNTNCMVVGKTDDGKRYFVIPVGREDCPRTEWFIEEESLKAYGAT